MVPQHQYVHSRRYSYPTWFVGDQYGIADYSDCGRFPGLITLQTGVLKLYNMVLSSWGVLHPVIETEGGGRGIAQPPYERSLFVGNGTFDFV